MPKTKKAKPAKSVNFIKDSFKLPEVEEGVLKYWKDHGIIEKGLNTNKGKKTFVFYEGPPGANGRPGTHHILPRVFKDIICRYKSMQGFFVPRKSGWDTHGLPVEITAEKELGLKTKKDIEAYGIAPFNHKCREVVWQYKSEWERYTDRIGFWLDLKDPYVTYENEYIETLWWIVKKIADKGLLYRGHKVVPWCHRCGTSLSSHELAQGYKEVVDRSIYMKFRVKPGEKLGDFKADQKTFILSWTTTPWTLPGNVALAVGEKIEYVVSKHEGENYILAKELSEKLGFHEVVETLKGKDLLGAEYEPLFDVPSLRTETAHKVYAADFVTTTDGTGVVHTAVMYGEDDYNLGVKVGLPQYHTVGEDGRFKSDIPVVAGMITKAKDGGAKETEDKIFEYLKGRGLVFKIEGYSHEYPHCWRCDTPLLYYARTSWFVSMSKLRNKLVSNNSKINWTPNHFKEGRFGEWLKEAKDWNFSRERYWGTPFPVWECKECDHWEALGGVADLEAKLPPVRNNYWVMRHGQCETNLFHISDAGTGHYVLTEKGKKQAKKGAEDLKKALAKKKKKIDLILTSPVLRTEETAGIVGKILDAPIEEAKDLWELRLGPEYAGSDMGKYQRNFPTYEDRFQKNPENGESLRNLRERMWRFLEETEKKYEGKNILIVSHEYPIWLLTHAASGWTEEEAIKEKKKLDPKDFIDNAEWRELKVSKVPRDNTGLVDLHRPYVDSPTFECSKCKKGKMSRVSGVIDVWYDSGAMPFAQLHYPFENKNLIDKRGLYPAEYICEAVDQTRGWFYTLLAVSTLLEEAGMKNLGPSFKNVICLGHVNDKHGKKMSKSKGNVVDPWEIMEKYGIDALRWYFFTATPPGEPKNFDENEVLKTYRKFHALIYNSFVFWQTYAEKNARKVSSKNVLDRWILARLKETSLEATHRLDKYEIREAGLAIESLADDLSRWYIRRSRRRLQKGLDRKDYLACSYTLGYVLKEITHLIAPFTPFFAEAMYHSFNVEKDKKESIHFTAWPKASGKADQKVLKAMAEAREISSLVLAERASVGIKVKQPLASLTIKNTRSALKGLKDLRDTVAEEVNVKKIIFNAKAEKDLVLDTKITEELMEEGLLREMVRTVQELRQKAGCSPKDKITLFLDLPEDLKRIMEKNEKALKLETSTTKVEYSRPAKYLGDMETELGDKKIWLALKK